MLLSVQRALLKNPSLGSLVLNFANSPLNDEGFKELQKFWRVANHLEKFSINICDCKGLTSRFFDDIALLKKENLKVFTLDAANCNIFTDPLSVSSSVSNLTEIETCEIRFGSGKTLENEESLRNLLLESGKIKLLVQTESGIIATSNPSGLKEKVETYTSDWKNLRVYFKQRTIDDETLTLFSEEALGSLGSTIQNLEINLSSCFHITALGLKSISAKIGLCAATL